jgi:DNA-binding IclR family transcriptional regulator
VAGAVRPRAQLLIRGGDATTSASQSLPRTSPELVLQRIRLIARTLEERPGLTSAELAERVGYGRRHMSLLLLRLEERGHVVRLDRRWFLGPEPVD